MPNSPSSEATGGESRDPLNFHKNLGDEKIHSIENIVNILDEFENSNSFERKTAPDIDLDEFLSHDQNIHWGSLEYVYKSTVAESTKLDAYVYFNYSPWLNVEKDILLMGRVVLTNAKDQYEVPQRVYTELNKFEEFELTVDSQDLCHFSLPTNMKNWENGYLITDALSAIELSN